LRVCYVTMRFPVPSETFASNEIKRLSAQGVEISVHCLRNTSHLGPELLAQRGLDRLEVTHNSTAATVRGLVLAAARPMRLLEVLAWLIGKTWTRPMHLAKSLLLLPRALDILREVELLRPDVVHIYWSHYPVIVGHLVQRCHPEIVSSISLAAYDLEMKYGGTASVTRRADVIRTLSRASRGEASSFTAVAPERMSVIYNGVDLAKVRAHSAGITKVPFKVATVGRLRRSKGMYEVLEAFAKVRVRWPGAALAVLGDGPEADGLRRRAAELGLEDVVEFLGHVGQDRVIEELARAEVLLLLTSADTERLPNVIKEGMACRCVCITTPTPGIEELVVDGRHGIIVPAHDPDAAADAMDDVFSLRVDVEEVIGAARRHIEANFDLGRTNVRYAHLWRDAVEARRASGAGRQVRQRPAGTGLFGQH
jgi:colanic acid/amylovoran biosynthesis glycosyltransferase